MAAATPSNGIPASSSDFANSTRRTSAGEQRSDPSGSTMPRSINRSRKPIPTPARSAASARGNEITFPTLLMAIRPVHGPVGQTVIVPGTNGQDARIAGGSLPLREEISASSEPAGHPRAGWTAKGSAFIARVGADPGDDDELRQRKALLVLLAILILPVSVVWGSLYLGFGEPVGFIPFVYFAVSLGSLLIFARTHNFRFLLNVQLLDVLLTTTAGQ